jgi:hypothetical protein
MLLRIHHTPTFANPLARELEFQCAARTIDFNIGGPKCSINLAQPTEDGNPRMVGNLLLAAKTEGDIELAEAMIVELMEFVALSKAWQERQAIWALAKAN